MRILSKKTVLTAVLLGLLNVSQIACSSGGAGSSGEQKPATDYSKGVPEGTERFLCQDSSAANLAVMVNVVYERYQVYFTGLRLENGEIPSSGDGRENVIQFPIQKLDLEDGSGLLFEEGDSAAERTDRYSKDFSFASLRLVFNQGKSAVERIIGTRGDGSTKIFSDCTLEEKKAPRGKKGGN